MIQTERQHGVAGLVNLFGIESPGLTSSLALARHVRLLLDADRGSTSGQSSPSLSSGSYAFD